MMKRDICCIGHITKDRVVTPRKTVYMPGGTSFYFAHAINNLPPKVSFSLVTKLASEDIEAVDKMRNEGLDIEVYASRHTVFFENKYGEDQDDRTQRLLAKADPFTIEELNHIDAKVYHLGSLLADDFSAGVVELLANKGKISIDAQGYLRSVQGEHIIATDWADKDSILAITDVLKVNEHEMEAITGLTDARAAAKQLSAKGVKEVCVTLGSSGSLIYANGRFYEIPAFPPHEIVDVTGCGDTYSAGYLYCRCLGADYEEAGRYAAAMCTLKLEHNGPFMENDSKVKAIVNH